MATACLLLSAAYVGSLYVLTPAAVRSLPRNHARHVRHRVAAVLLSTVTSVVVARGLLGGPLAWPAMGFRGVGLVEACTWPLLAFGGLFLGPLVQVALGHTKAMVVTEGGDDEGRLLIADTMAGEEAVWLNLRNLVVAPVSEEVVFRAVFCAIMAHVGGYPRHVVVYATPLFFGVAHLHHFLEAVRQGDAVSAALTRSLFQFTYTSLFGVLQNYVFLSTLHVAAVILTHAFCNLMGFPRVDMAFSPGFPLHERVVVLVAYVLGIAFFLWRGFALATDASLYQ